MRNEKVVELPDSSPGNHIVFATPEFSPANPARFAAGDRLSVTLRLRGRLCSPFMVYLYPETKSAVHGLTLVASPSLVYPAGEVDRKVEHFFGFRVDENNVRPGAEAAVVKLRISVQQYGSYKQLAAYEIPLAAVWRAPHDLNVAGIPDYECLADANIPPALPQVEAPRCSSSVKAPDNGLRLDLDGDGICEWAARDERCDKILGNRCYRIYQERDGALHAIAQYYNELRIHDDGAVFRALSSVESGAKSNFTHFDEWVDGRYVHHMYLHDCKLLP